MNVETNNPFSNLKTFLEDLLHVGGDTSLHLTSNAIQNIFDTLMNMDGSKKEIMHDSIGNYRLMLQLTKYPDNQDNRYRITVYINGMKYYDGLFDSNFLQNSSCTYYKEGIPIQSGEYVHGKKHGYFTYYDFDTCKEVAREEYSNDVKITDIYVVDGRKYRETIANDVRMVGEVDVNDAGVQWSGRVLEYRNGLPSCLYDYSHGKRIVGQFAPSQGFDGFLEYDDSKNPTYFGSIQLNERTLEYHYEGRGIKFVLNSGVPCIVYKGEFKNGVYFGQGCTYSPEFGLKLFEGEFLDGEPTNGVSFANGVIQKFTVHTCDDMQNFPPNYELFEVSENGLCNEAQVDFHSYVSFVKQIVFGESSCDSMKTCLISEFHNLVEVRFENDSFKSADKIVLNSKICRGVNDR